MQQFSYTYFMIIILVQSNSFGFALSILQFKVPKAFVL